MSWDEIPVQEDSSSSSSPPLKGEKQEEMHVGDSMQWSAEFWDEDDSVGEELIRCGALIHGQINVFEGHYEQGKTVVMIDLARQWIRSHGPVLYLDFEMGLRRVRKRMKANQWTVEDLDKWYYRYAPNLEGEGHLAVLAQLLGPDLLICMDSFSAAMMALGLEENSATETGGWWSELQAACQQGATVALIDQVKQTASAASAYGGRGTGAKSFGADVKWFVERFEKFTPTQPGVVRMTLKKDREGVLAERLGFEVGDGKGNLTVTPTDPPRGAPANPELLNRVEDVFASDGIAKKEGGWMSLNMLDKALEGYGSEKIAKACEYMTDRGILEYDDKIPGKGGGAGWRLNSETEG